MNPRGTSCAEQEALRMLKNYRSPSKIAVDPTPKINRHSITASRMAYHLTSVGTIILFGLVSLVNALANEQNETNPASSPAALENSAASIESTCPELPFNSFPPKSDLGFASSTDGIHWTKSPANPIIRRQGPTDSQEDPDLLWAQDEKKVYLEYVTHLPKEEEVMSSSADWIHWSEPWLLNHGKTWGKIGGMIDLRDGPLSPGINFQGGVYRYMAMIEEGRIDLSQDLHTWVKAGLANLVGRPDWWCNAHECSGDIFIDADHNIRYEAQAGVKSQRSVIVGNPLCTLVEGLLSGTDPTKVLWRSDLPWLPDWYGDAPTGSPEDFTASNGSVFPGQTILKDGWLWQFSGGNNTFTVLSKCWYGPLFEYRNLQTKIDSTQCSVTVRNIGSLKGSGRAILTLDGRPASEKEVRLDRDTETVLQWTLPMPAGIHTVAIDDVSASVEN